jgi:curved DNA-binding protein CbpA
MATTDTFGDYYKVLEVDRHCAAESIEKSYQELALSPHPNKPPKDLVNAYKVLKDPHARDKYNLLYDRKQGKQANRATPQEDILDFSDINEFAKQGHFGTHKVPNLILMKKAIHSIPKLPRKGKYRATWDLIESGLDLRYVYDMLDTGRIDEKKAAALIAREKADYWTLTLFSAVE